jgi:hypothetical protein
MVHCSAYFTSEWPSINVGGFSKKRRQPAARGLASQCDCASNKINFLTDCLLFHLKDRRIRSGNGSNSSIVSRWPFAPGSSAFTDRRMRARKQWLRQQNGDFVLLNASIDSCGKTKIHLLLSPCTVEAGRFQNS